MFYVSMLVFRYRGRRAVMSTNTTYLKKINPDELLRRFKNGEGKVLAKELGYRNYDSFLEAVKREYGLSTEDVVSPIAEEKSPEIINLPPIKLREYKKRKVKRGDEEEACLHIGDAHAGKITASYDEDVFRQRMDTMFDSIMTIIALHRNMYPINRLRIFNTGDNTQGENPYQGSVLGSVKMGARDQTSKLAYPTLSKFIGSLKQEFTEVIFEGYPGNHGYERLAPETSREDLRLYDLLRAYFEDKRGITINIHEKFSDMVEVMGFRFFAAHLDGIPSHSGIPLFAIKRRLDAWFIQFGGFNYALGAHFHKRVTGDEMSSQYEFSMVSTLVSDDEWALKKLGISANPSQNIFGVHPRFGMTWRYPVVVDKKFLPEKRGVGL